MSEIYRTENAGLTIGEQKALLRKEMLKKRGALDPTEKGKYDKWICEVLWERIEQRSFNVVHCYLPMGSEVDIWPLIDTMMDHNRTVLIPKALPGRNFQNLVYRSRNDLAKGVFGTQFPANAKPYEGKIEFVIVPGLAFDGFNNRLGYGGGYYDTFLKAHGEAERLGIGYPFQKLKTIPTEEHDFPLHGLIIPN